MKVLIIEDEVTAVRGLRKMVSQIDPSCQFVGELASVREAIDWFAENEDPDLIFLDIQLKDDLSFSIFEKVDCKSPIIFCTAYNHYALQAFKLNSVDYLVKPYDIEELTSAINKHKQVNKNIPQIDYRQLAEAMQHPVSFKERFLVKAGKNFYHVNADKIDYFYTRDKVNFLKTSDGKQFVIDEYLDELEQVLDPNQFFRINRQFIVSIKAVESIENDYGKLHVKLNDENPSISRSRINEFKRWLGQEPSQ